MIEMDWPEEVLSILRTLDSLDAKLPQEDREESESVEEPFRKPWPDQREWRYPRRRRVPVSISGGEDMAKRISNDQRLGGGAFNLIPGGMPGPCRSTLVVAIGVRDSVEERIYQAIEHCFAHCPGVTRYVIFWAAHWDSVSWKSRMRAFSRRANPTAGPVTSILRPILASPCALKVP